MAIVFRTVGPWGAGKGSNLTEVEVDNNFWDHEQRIDVLETNPPEAVSIDHFVIVGTLLTIVMTNGDEHGPFVLPVAQWRWTGEWQPLTTYFVGDIIEESGNIYFVRVQHISATTFDPDLFTGEGQVYILILAKASQPYDIGMFFNDSIPSGDAIIMMHVAVRSITIASHFGISQAFLKVATSTSPITLPIYHNETIVGTLTFTPGALLSGAGQFGTFSGLNTDPIELVATDRLSIGLPYESDATASNLAVTIVGTVAGL